MTSFELPTRSGAYRWYYLDVVAGDFTAVCIFMVGSVFSARYSASLREGAAPSEHAAVNFALYEKGARSLWVLSEYRGASLADDGRTLRIGKSWLTYDGGRLAGEVRDRTTPFLLTQWGEPAHVSFELEPEGPPHPEIRLVDGLSHHWRPIAARARARVQLHSHGLAFRGAAYHDGNHGEAPLGSDLRGWEWARVHEACATAITYRPWGAPAALVRVSASEATCRREILGEPASVRSSWGLQVPRSLGVSARPRTLESAPFYARLEASWGDVHALGEVADFRRFHHPAIRWMANFRTRAGGAAW